MKERMYDIALEVLKGDPVLETWTFSSQELERFAELIVKECCQVLSDSVATCYNDSGSVAYPVWNIKKHFGVE